MNKIRLTRMGPGKYSARVRSKNSGFPAFTAYVTGPDPSLPKSAFTSAVHFPDRWMVETDHERFFRDMFQVRRYLDTFFEPAPKED